MKLPLSVVLTIACAAPAAAQGFVSSPKGYEFTEGSSDERYVLGSWPTLRFQQIDSTNDDPLPNIGQLGFRRDGRLFTSPLYPGRTIDMEIVMAESDIDNLSTTFATNYVANQLKVVNRKTIQFPDWSQQSILPPSPLTAIVALDVPWSYSGKTASGNDLLWEVRVWSNSEAGKEYPFDLAYVVPNATFGTTLNPTRSGHTDLGSGCQVALGEAHMDIDIFNFGSKFTLDAHLHTAPNQPVTLMIGLFNANLSHPSLCTKLHVLGVVNLGVGVAAGNGDFDIDIDPIAYNAAYIGQDLFFQTVAPDASQTAGGFMPVALSSAAKITVPEDPRPPAVGRLWAADPAATTALFGPVAGGIILHTNQ